MRVTGAASSRWSLLAGLALLAVLAAIAAAAIAGDIPAWNRALAWLFEQQRAFHDALARNLRSLAAEGGGTAAATLVGLSFVYGVLHAAGPGHGKAVLAAYLLAQPQQARRGVALAAAAALCQGIVAVVLIYGLILVAGWLPRDTSAAVAWSERASFALVAGLGALLAGRGVLALFGRGHARHHRHGHCHHAHESEPEADSHGHSHGPTAEQMAAAGNPRQFLGVVLAIGLRPCSGAVLVLVLAHVLRMPAAGIAAVALMSLGTGMATAALAFLTVRLRGVAVRFAAARLPGAAVLGNGIAVAGGILLLMLGLSLLTGSFAPAHPFRV